MRRAALIALAFVFCGSALCIGFAQDQDEQVSTRKVIFRMQPQYPPLARSAHIGGITRVMAHVNSTGKAESVQVLGGHPLLVQAAVAAVSHWKWEPSSQPTQEVVVIRFSTTD
jgi:TonB family protein